MPTDYEQAILDLEPVFFFREESGGDLIDLGSDGVDIPTVGGLTNNGVAPLIAGESQLPLASGSGKWAEQTIGNTNHTLLGDLTLHAKFMMTAAPSVGANARLIYCNSETASTASANNCLFNLSVRNNGGTPVLEWYHENGSGVDNVLRDTVEIEVGVMYDVFAVRDATAGSVTFTINGVAGAAITSGWTAAPTDGANTILCLGGWADGASRLIGYYDALCAWDKVLTPGQMARITDIGDGATGSLVSAETTNRYTLHPAQRGVYHDGQRYWVFYPSGTTLKCKYGPTLDDLTDSSTGLPDTLAAEGMSYGVEFGVYDGSHRVWIAASKTSAGDGLILYTAELTASGLGAIASRDIARDPVTYAVPRVQRNYTTGDVTDIYVASMERDNSDQSDSVIALRRFEPDASADTDGGTYDPTGPGSCNHAVWGAVVDGYLAAATDSGNSLGSGHEGTRTQTSTTIGGSKTEGDLVQTDQAYASVTAPYNHATTSALLQQLGTGKFWIAYKDDTDASGRWGKVTLAYHDASVSGSWHTISTDLVGGSVWHLAMTQSSDGGKLVLVYAKNETGNLRGHTIYGRTYDTVTGRLSAEAVVANISPGRMVDCMVMPPTADLDRIPLLWSEHEGSISGGTGSGGNTWIMGLDIAGAIGSATQPIGVPRALFTSPVIGAA